MIADDHEIAGAIVDGAADLSSCCPADAAAPR
jgi:hypothetical protein